jgi:hypothetical protein
VQIADPNGAFEPEDVVVSGDRASIRWRYRFGEGDENSVRGVNLMHVRDGKIVEALGYVKAGLRPELRPNHDLEQPPWMTSPRSTSPERPQRQARHASARIAIPRRIAASPRLP